RNIQEGIDVLTPRSKTRTFIYTLAKECDCSVQCVIDTIKKTKTRTYCALEDVHMKLINELKSCTLLKGLTESKINELADKILVKAFRASSIFPDDADISIKVVLGIATLDDEVKGIINAKCVKGPDLF